MNSIPNILMILESSKEYGRMLISGITDYAKQCGPWHFHGKSGSMSLPVKVIGGIEFDGALVADSEDIEPLLEAGIPTVAFSYFRAPGEGLSIVKNDDYSISNRVAEHFFERGFVNFGFLGYDDNAWSTQRGRAFAKIVGRAGYNLVSNWTAPPPSGVIDEASIVRWLQVLPRPVAVMAANDDLGEVLIRLCREANLRVPEDCAVVSVDDDPGVCGICHPPLSSLGVNQHQAGYQAAATLDKMIRGEAIDSEPILATVGDLSVRQSSDIFAANDRSVTKALHFIHAHAHRPIQVDEVAHACGLHRRAIERRFQRSTCQSILQYCKQVRARHIGKILRDSDLILEDIAEQCGFSQASHLSRFFSSVHGESPSAYRKRMKIKGAVIGRHSLPMSQNG